MNNPAITVISLTTFLMAKPKSSPPKNPPPSQKQRLCCLCSSLNYLEMSYVHSKYVVYLVYSFLVSVFVVREINIYYVHTCILAIRW
jgi:hypothetical protein